MSRLCRTPVYRPIVESTNDVAAALAAEDPGDGILVLADQQTAGRGRRGHTWFSPPASGLYVSAVVTPLRARVDPARALALVTLTAGVALAEAIESACGLRVELKWPNDLYVGRRKIGGILAESTGSRSVVIGYGINVSAAAFPPELRNIATSIELELGRSVDRTPVLVESVAALDKRYGDLLDAQYDAILDAWRSRSPSSLGTGVEWSTPAGPQSGVTAGVDEQGALLVRTGTGIERIIAGELRWEL